MKKTGKVLIVDDVEINRSLLADMLVEEYDILEAADGVDALDLLYYCHSEISLVLLDIIMPRMDGFEVLAAMHTGGYLEEIPVIIISAETSSSYIDRAYDMGAAEYISRPFDEKIVKHRVRNTITLYSRKRREYLMDMELDTKKCLEIPPDGGVSGETLLERTHLILNSSDISNRTLTLLEQERIKYHFFAQMSNEIQFEYDRRTDLLTISDWGAQLLGIKAVITHPQVDDTLARIFSREDYLDIQKRLHAAIQGATTVEQVYCLNIKGRRRWHKMVARPLWPGCKGEMTGIIGKFTDIHVERQEMDRLKQLALYDSLTGLYNRECALECIQKKLVTGLALKKRYALILLDLDSFKKANDQYGHMFGDRVLAAVAEKLQKNTREMDVAARIGGDEFLLFMEYQEDTASLIERLFQMLGGRYEEFEINVSMGIALAPQDGTEYEELFLHADQALYTAKREGRQRYHYYNDSMKNLLFALSTTHTENINSREMKP